MTVLAVCAILVLSVLALWFGYLHYYSAREVSHSASTRNLPASLEPTTQTSPQGRVRRSSARLTDRPQLWSMLLSGGGPSFAARSARARRRCDDMPVAPRASEAAHRVHGLRTTWGVTVGGRGFR
jgi:hypothetical protein